MQTYIVLHITNNEEGTAYTKTNNKAFIITINH